MRLSALAGPGGLWLSATFSRWKDLVAVSLCRTRTFAGSRVRSRLIVAKEAQPGSLELLFDRLPTVHRLLEHLTSKDSCHGFP